MEKISTVLDAEHDITDRPGARDSVASTAGSSSTASCSPTGRARRPRARVRRPGRRLHRARRRVGRRQVDDREAHRALLRPRLGARCASTASTSATSSLRSYRRQLGVVLQDPFLFSGTIADNIRFARPDATDEEVEAAARAIGVDRVAARFEEGLDHVVREGGAGLSAGERQLISIARALLADPRILILDEATSNIDRPTEVLIERAFDTLLRGRTSIIIAHRLDDRPPRGRDPRLEHGRIVQRGPLRRAARGRRPVPAPRDDARGRQRAPGRVARLARGRSSTQTSSRRIGVAEPSAARPSTSTSGRRS